MGLLGVIVAATPAAAAVSGSINSPTDGTNYPGYQKLGVDGTVNYSLGDHHGIATITATDPDSSGPAHTGCVFQVASSTYPDALVSNTTDVPGTIDLNAAYPESCPVAYKGKPAVNGKWQLTLANDSGTIANGSFTTAVPPAAPASVRVSSPAPLTVAVTWAPNPEVDTHAYAVLDAGGKVVSGPVDAAAACSTTTCTASFPVASAGSQGFSVRADRRLTPNSPMADDLMTASAATAVTVRAGSTAGEAPAAGSSAGAPSPSSNSAGSKHAGTHGSASRRAPAHASPGSPGSSSKRSGGNKTAKSKVSRDEAAKISSRFRAIAAPAGIGKLPPLPKLDPTGAVTDLPVIAGDGEPTDQGTYKLSLGYAPQTKVVETHTTVPGAPLASVANAIGVSPSTLWQSLAGSMLLLLSAGHVRRWVRQPIE